MPDWDASEYVYVQLADLGARLAYNEDRRVVLETARALESVQQGGFRSS